MVTNNVATISFLATHKPFQATSSLCKNKDTGDGKAAYKTVIMLFPSTQATDKF